MPQERLDIVISQKGAKTVRKDINGIGKEAEKGAKSTGLLKKALGGLGVALAVREVTRLADSYTTMQNRLKTVTKSQQQLNDATKEVFKIANRARQGVAGTVEFYARLSGAAKELGKSQSELLAITETVTKAVALSGATTAESAGALRQLSQGLGSGTLRGQELNSVLEQLPIIADIIADSLGVARGELRGLAEDGKLTADVVVTALEGAAGRIETAFGQSVPTIAQSFDVLRNNLTQFVGELDQATGVSRFFSNAIISIADNLNTIIPLLAAVAAITAFNKLRLEAVLFVGALKNGITVVKSLTTALFGLRAAQAATVGSSAVAGGATSLSLFNAFFAGGGAAAGTTSAAGAGLSSIATGAAAAVGPTVAIAAALAAVGAAIIYTSREAETYSDVLIEVEDATTGLTDSSEGLAGSTEKVGDAFKATESNLENHIRLLLAAQKAQAGLLDEIIPQVARRGRGGLFNLAQGGLEEVAKEELPGIVAQLKKLQNAEQQIGNAKGAENIQRLAETIKQAGDSIRDAVPSSSKNSVDQVLKTYTNLQDRIAGVLELNRKVNTFEVPEEQLAGSSQQKLAAEINATEKAYGDLIDANFKGEIATKDFAQAQGFLLEKLDKLRGGGNATLEELKRYNEALKKFNGDEEAAELSLAGVTDRKIRMIQEQETIKAGILQVQKDQVIAEREAAREAERLKQIDEQRLKTINNLLEAKRKEVQLFGQTANQREVSFLKDQGADDTKVAELESLQRQIGTLQQFQTLVASASALFQEYAAFQQSAEQVQTATADAVEQVQTTAQQNLAAGALEISEASQQLFQQIGTFLNTATDLVLTDTQAAFTLGAQTIGTATAQAFIGAFQAGLGGAVSGFLSGLTTGGANTAGQGGQVDPAIQAKLRALQELRAANERLLESLNKVGPTSARNFSQGSAAAQQFGQNTTNIGTQINNVFQNAFGGLESALTQFVTTGKLDFKSLINSIIADLARMVVQMLIIKPLMGFFGGIFGGFFGFSQGGFVGGNLPGFATGGIVGGFGGSTSDNQLARLSPGEFVMNASSTKKNRAALEYTNQTGKMPMVSGGGGGSMVFAPTIIVNQEGGQQGDGESTGMDIEATVRRLWTEMAVKSQRSGAVFGSNRTGG